MTVMSMLSTSPALSFFSPGIPWQTTWLTDVQHDCHGAGAFLALLRLELDFQARAQVLLVAVEIAVVEEVFGALVAFDETKALAEVETFDDAFHG